MSIRPVKKIIQSKPTLEGAGVDAARFGDPRYPHFHAGDLDWALRVDAFDFAVSVTREGGLPIARLVRPA